MRIDATKWKNRLQQHYPTILTASAILLTISLIFGQSIKTILIVSLLIITATFSTFYYNFFKNNPINFELIKFATILISVKYGATLGITAGIISTISSKVLSEKLDHTAIPSLAGITLVALAASTFPETDITKLGIILVIAYHLLTAPIQLAFGGTLLYGAAYVGSNLIFNLFLFGRIAPTLIRVM